MYEALIRPMLQQPGEPDKLAAHMRASTAGPPSSIARSPGADYLAAGRFTCRHRRRQRADYAQPARMPLDEHPPLRAWFDGSPRDRPGRRPSHRGEHRIALPHPPAILLERARQLVEDDLATDAGVEGSGWYNYF